MSVNFTAAERKALAIFGVLVLLFGVVVIGGAAGLAQLTKSDDDHRPYMQIAVGDQLTRVYPIIWCDVYMRECDPPIGSKVTRTKTHVPVKVGETALVSVSEDIASGPWSYTAEYYTPQGLVQVGDVFRSNTRFTIAIPSTAERTLLTIEVKTPSAATESGDFRIRGFLSADTAPQRPADGA